LLYLYILYYGCIMTFHVAFPFSTMFVCLFLFTLSIPIPVRTQVLPSDVRFQHFSVEQGLSHAVVNTITQDGAGKLWFGTDDGLSEYDGITFTDHRYLPTTPLGNGITTIIGAFHSYQSIWLTTANKRYVLHFNPRSSTFTAVAIPPNAAPVRNFFGDSTGTIFMAASGGLFLLDTVAMKFRALAVDGISNESLDMRHVVELSGKMIGDRRCIVTTRGFYIVQTLEKFPWLKKLQANLSIPGRCMTASVGMENGRNLLWIGTQSGGVHVFEAESGEANDDKLYRERYHFGTENGLPSPEVRSILVRRNGETWIGTAKGIAIVQNGKITRTLQHDAYDASTLAGEAVQAMYEDVSGVVWAATEFYGINKYSPFQQKFTRYSTNLLKPTQSLNSNFVRGIAEDAIGRLWIATQTGGVNCFNRRTGKWTYFGKQELQTDTILSICLDRKQTVWIGTAGNGVWQLSAGKQSFTRYAGIPADASVRCLYEDRSGALWLAGANLPLTMMSADHKGCQVVEKLRNESVLTILQNKSGVYLVGTESGLVVYNHNTGTDNAGTITAQHSLKGAAVQTLCEDKTGTLWIGTNGRGMMQSSKGDGTNLYTLEERSGMPSNVICAIMQGAGGHLWVSTKKGLAEIDPDRRSVVRTYNTDDGLQGQEFLSASAFGNNVTDELFFGGTGGFTCFFPENIRTNNTPPPVVITSVKKFGREEMFDSVLQQNRTITLRYDENTLSFSFVALDYNAPETNQYAYKLDGMDKGWIRSGTRREATYTSLDAGEYTFHVRAANNDGVWNDTGAMLRVVVDPPLWRTWWFIGLSVASGVCIAFVAYRARVRSIEMRSIWLERQIEDRTAEITMANAELKQSFDEISLLSTVLEGERLKAENLLLNILPPSIAERLQWGEAIVDTFDNATVIFSDMVGFTKIAARVSAEELIMMLNRMFSEFDRLADKHNVEKIKTIGDAYMAVAGVPIPSDHHAESVADMALDMIKAIRSIAENEGLPISIRVGIHTGKLTAGVIGEKKFAYDLWGDTVNTASRMESSGEAGRVHCSEALYLALHNMYDFEERGVIEVKGKGAMKTYFIIGKKSSATLA
jgi:class 3 adenylate cyclase/ligand-binding sensor domain-containing protein